MSRYFYDCEFIDDGFTIKLISIGIVCDDGREYYAVNADVSDDAILHNTWLRENVWPTLPTRPLTETELSFATAASKSKSPLMSVRRQMSVQLGTLDRTHLDVKPKAIIASEVREFLLGGSGPVELWAYYGAYDHVALAQLFGKMIDLPTGLPMFTHDIMQAAGGLSEMLPAQESGQHNALDDARHVKVMWTALLLLGYMGAKAGMPVPRAVRPRARTPYRSLSRLRLRRPLSKTERIRAELAEKKANYGVRRPIQVLDYPSDPAALEHYGRGGVVRVARPIPRPGWRG